MSQAADDFALWLQILAGKMEAMEALLDSARSTRTAFYLRVSTANQKPDLRSDERRAQATHATLEVIQDHCDVGVSGRREGRPQRNDLMVAVRNHEIPR
jgi:predicted site-specific integrase-resolvase